MNNLFLYSKVRIVLLIFFPLCLFSKDTFVLLIPFSVLLFSNKFGTVEEAAYAYSEQLTTYGGAAFAGSTVFQKQDWEGKKAARSH